VFAHEAPAIQNGRTLQRGQAADDDPQRLTGGVGIDRGDLSRY